MTVGVFANVLSHNGYVVLVLPLMIALMSVLMVAVMVVVVVVVAVMLAPVMALLMALTDIALLKLENFAHFAR